MCVGYYLTFSVCIKTCVSPFAIKIKVKVFFQYWMHSRIDCGTILFCFVFFFPKSLLWKICPSLVDFCVAKGMGICRKCIASLLCTCHRHAFLWTESVLRLWLLMRCLRFFSAFISVGVMFISERKNPSVLIFLYNLIIGFSLGFFSKIRCWWIFKNFLFGGGVWGKEILDF